MEKIKVVLIGGLGVLIVLAAVAGLRRSPVAPAAPAPRSCAGNREAAPELSELPVASRLPAEPALVQQAPRLAAEARTLDLTALRASRRAEQEFWEDLATLVETRRSVDQAQYRRALTSRTTEFLGLEQRRADAFEQTSSAALAGIGQAWRERDQAILSLPAGMGPDDRLRRELAIQRRYEDSKRAEVERIEALLDATPRHDQFRRKLGEWIDAAR